MEYLIREPNAGKTFGVGRTVQVAYDYKKRKTIPLPANWRNVIQEYEGLTPAQK
jgi:acyl-CoA thioester hydrolase